MSDELKQIEHALGEYTWSIVEGYGVSSSVAGTLSHLLQPYPTLMEVLQEGLASLQRQRDADDKADAK